MTLEIKQANNPGFTDFGSGAIIALTSQCLRCTRKPTPCTICSDFCPVNAIETTLDGRPRITSGCIKCAACVGVCPANALGCSTRNIQQFNRQALQATLRVEHLAICCERTPALLRLLSQTDDPQAAIDSLHLIREVQSRAHLLLVPCLAMITRELWFSVLNEIGTLQFEKLSVFLPPGQCAECPVNTKDNVEDLFGEAIVAAENWSNHSVGIITQAKDLPQSKKANVRAYLASADEMDRRGAFAGFLDELKQSWEENAEVGNKALNEVRIQRERKKSFERTLLSEEQKKPRLASRSPISVPTRYSLIEALGRNDEHAKDVRLLISATKDKRCDCCGTCVDVCPVKARAIKEAGTNDTETASQQPGESDDTLTCSDQKVAVNALYCIACSACIQACPQEACYFIEIDGSEFLVDESKTAQETQTESEAVQDEQTE